jgi:uncharacterized protein
MYSFFVWNGGANKSFFYLWFVVNIKMSLMKATKQQIEEFLSRPSIAMAGYSRNPKKFGGSVYNTLIEKGYNIVPVNPAGGLTPQGTRIYENLTELPGNVNALLIMTKPEVSTDVVKQAIEKGITHIWVQQSSENEEVKELLKEQSCVIIGQCILMYTDPGGIHKVHRWLAGLFGVLPS